MTAATPFAARMKGDVSNSSAIVDGTVNPPAAVFASAHSSLRAMSVLRGSTNLAYWRLPLVYLVSANCGYCGVLQVWGTVGYVRCGVLCHGSCWTLLWLLLGGGWRWSTGQLLLHSTTRTTHFLLNDHRASRTSEEGVDSGVLVTDIHERVFGQCAELKERFDHLNRRSGVEVTLSQAGWYEASLSNATDSALLPR